MRNVSRCLPFNGADKLPAPRWERIVRRRGASGSACDRKNTVLPACCAKQRRVTRTPKVSDRLFVLTGQTQSSVRLFNHNSKDSILVIPYFYGLILEIAPIATNRHQVTLLPHSPIGVPPAIRQSPAPASSAAKLPQACLPTITP